MDKSISFIKNFFDKYYEKLNTHNDILLYSPCVPKDMIAEDSNSDDEWEKWKLIKSTVSDDDIKKIEDKINIKLPEILKSFYTTYYHMFESPIGEHSSDNPFAELLNSWNPILVKNGYLPFTWDKDHYMIRSIDLKNMPNELACPICEIDHAILFEFDENVTRNEIETNMNQISINFYTYLTELLEADM